MSSSPKPVMFRLDARLLEEISVLKEENAVLKEENAKLQAVQISPSPHEMVNS
jgi:hypothetical protein